MGAVILFAQLSNKTENGNSPVPYVLRFWWRCLRQWLRLIFGQKSPNEYAYDVNGTRPYSATKRTFQGLTFVFPWFWFVNFPSFPCVLTFLGSLAIISPLRYWSCRTLEGRLFKGANILNCSSRLTFLKHVSVQLHGRPVSFLVPLLQSCFFSYASCPPEKVKKKVISFSNCALARPFFFLT